MADNSRGRILHFLFLFFLFCSLSPSSALILISLFLRFLLDSAVMNHYIYEFISAKILIGETVFFGLIVNQ